MLLITGNKMSTPQERLAQYLAVLKKLQDKGIVAIHTKTMTRTHRERLVIRGWYVSFCADYLKSKFGNKWCLFPAQSLSIHSGNWSVPRQPLVRTPKGGNKPK